MPFSFTNSRGNTYFLHAKTTTLKSGKLQSLYYFSREIRDGVLEMIPDGYEIAESKSGLPVLRKKT
jgi:hypothetical protein